MKTWTRRLVLVILWMGVGACIGGVLGMVVGNPTVAAWPFGVGLVVVVALIFVAGPGSAGTTTGASSTSRRQANPTASRSIDAPQSPARVEPLRETGVAEAAAPEPSRTGRGALALKFAVVAVCVVAGAALSLVIVAGGSQRLVEAVAEIPARATGQVHGLWDSRRLDLELADLQTQVGPRDVESLVLFERSMSLWAFSETDPKGADVYWFRDGRLEESSKSTAVSFASPFRLADLDAEVVNEVTRRIYADTPGAEIENLVIRNPQGKGVRIDVSIAGEYDDASRIFDARTGEEVGPR